jgi:hypothetical protein
MKNPTSSAAALLFALIFSTPAVEAAPRSSKNAAPHESVSMTSSAPEYSGGSKRLGLGFQTLSAGNPALSAMMDVGPSSSLQLLVGINNTHGYFGFDAGGVFRSALMGTANAGVHGGADLVLGTVAGTTGGSAFAIAFGPLAGVHFTVPNLSSLLVTLDGGAQFAFNDGNFDFSLGGLSPALGLGVHYFF